MYFLSSSLWTIVETLKNFTDDLFLVSLFIDNKRESDM